MKLLMMLCVLSISTTAMAATVTIICKDGKTFTLHDPVDHPNDLGKEMCKDNEGYKEFKATFSNNGMPSGLKPGN